MKRTDHAIVGDSDEESSELLPPQSKVKVVTKAALAKKVIKKKILSNQVNVRKITY